VVCWPVPPTGWAFLSEPWPFALTPDGFSTVTLAAPNPGRRAAGPAEFRSWDRLADRDVTYGGGQGSRRLHPQFRALLDEVAHRPVSQRGARIRDALRESLDVENVRIAIQTFAARTRMMRALADWFVFPAFFILMPVVYWRAGTGWAFLILLAAGWVVLIATSWSFFREHRRAFPERIEERWQNAILAAILPQHAVRVPQVLAKEWLIKFHPLAIAAATESAEPLREFAGRVWRDVVFPLPAESMDPQALDAAREFHERFLRPALEALLEREGLDVASLLAPPASDLPSPAYCPRCHATFAVVDSCCADCGGLAVMPVHPAPSGTEL
jgi:hypothetical protein